jgi:hypothetical protein
MLWNERLRRLVERVVCLSGGVDDGSSLLARELFAVF